MSPLNAPPREPAAPSVLWEDDDLLVVEKPVGWLVDAGAGDTDLVSWVRARGRACEQAFAFHRLDRGTSGVVLLGKTRKYAKPITEAFEAKRIRKAYLAVVHGEWPTSLNRVETPIEDRPSVTTFRRLAVGSVGGAPASLIECLPKTGRTHQIRIHCASAGYPILGDDRYGTGVAGGRGLAGGPGPASASGPAGRAVGQAASSALGHALHAYRLDFRHPADGRTVAIRCAPDDWRVTWLKDFDIEKLWSQIT